MSSRSQILLSLLLNMWSSSECFKMSVRSSRSHPSRFLASLTALSLYWLAPKRPNSSFSLFFCTTASVLGGSSFPLRDKLRLGVFLKLFSSPISCSKLLQSFLSSRSLLLKEYSCFVVPWQTRSTKSQLSSLRRDCGTERPQISQDLPGELRTSLYIYQKNPLIIVPQLSSGRLFYNGSQSDHESFEDLQYMFYDQAEQEMSLPKHRSPEVITVQVPGRRVDLPQSAIKELQSFWSEGRKRLPFFGGHPASITKQSCNEIFKSLNSNRQSPYLLCEKTDGVRYLLVIAKVKFAELNRELVPGEQAPYTEFFMVSRQGNGKLVAYAVDVGLSHLLEAASTEVGPSGGSVVAVLDGELIMESDSRQIRYLIFDALVHLGKDICGLPLRDRLQCATNLLRCSEMLGVRPHRIDVRVKDFFRLNCGKFNVVEFLLKKYVKCLPHQNDGIIFNHQEKPYLRGVTNPGYIKWKPAHLNTVDFMIVPNFNFEEQLQRKVLDLYLAVYDVGLESYTRQFYAFAIVDETAFSKLQQLYYENQARAAEQQMKRQMASDNYQVQADPFAGAIIAECRYQDAKTEERLLMTRLCKMKADELLRNIMKEGHKEKDAKAIQDMSKKIHEKGWHIYKLRADKSLPNNSDVARRIEQSIRDGITEPELIKKTEELNKMVYEQQFH